jgi:hypothetical protein
MPKNTLAKAEAEKQVDAIGDVGIFLSMMIYLSLILS